MFETVAQLTPSSASVSRSATLLVNAVQPGQNPSGPTSMNWYTASWSRPSNRSTSDFGPPGASNWYSPNRTIGSRPRPPPPLERGPPEPAQRQPPAPRRQRVQRPGRLFLGHHQLVPGLLPVLR